MKLVHSHSSLKDYKSCPLMYQHKRVLKDILDTKGEAAKWGEQVHKDFELRVKDGTPLPEYLEHFEPHLFKIALLDTKCEWKVALNDNLKPCDFFAPEAFIRGVIDLYAAVGGAAAVLIDYKGLPLDTELPTPSGFTTIQRVCVGDILFSESGEQCMVVGKSQVKNLPCYEIVFDDTTRIICDNEHLWKLVDGSVVAVSALRPKDKVAVAAPLAISNVVLPIDPYVLGLWLADGKHTSGEITKPDSDIWDEVCSRGYEISHDYSARAGGGKCRVHTVKGLRTQLREASLLGNKHVPGIYLRAGYQQRLDLLRGLMDGDGSANPTRKQAVFMNTDRKLSEAVCELLCTLGQRPLMSTTHQFGFGKNVTAYPVSFRPIGINPFYLPRKAARIDSSWGSGSSTVRHIVSVTGVKSVSTQCIAVDSVDHTFLCTRKMVPTHNTGKMRDEKDQLELGALFAFAHDETLQEVRTAYFWTQAKCLTPHSIQREEVNTLWAKVLHTVKQIDKSVEHDKWPARPSGLCNYCGYQPFCKAGR